VSIHKTEHGKWRVKWKVAGRQQSRNFDRKGDAVLFDSEIKRRRQLGVVLAAEVFDRGRSELSLAEFVSGPWRSYAATLSSASRAKYAWALTHLDGLVGEPLVGIDVAMLAGYQRMMLDKGCTASTVREVMSKLGGLLQVACEHGLISANPARALRKPRAEVVDEANPLTPVELERLIAILEGRDQAIALLGGHLGLRPREIRLVPWLVLGRTLMVGKSVAKVTAQRTRTITVPEVTLRELREWRLRSGRPDNGDPVIGAMTPNAMKLWNTRRLRPAVNAATKGRITDATVYTLRHSHASALHYCGFTVPEAARRLGHGPELHLRTYAHVIDGMGSERWPDLDAMIASARSDLRFPQGSLGTVDGRPDAP
jgi:integrase